MSIHFNAMSEQENTEFFEALERINHAGNAVKVIAWALTGMAVAGISVAGWVFTVNQVQTEHSEELRELTPKVIQLETRAVRFDAAPPPTQAQFHDIDKRLDRTEVQLLDIREQTQMILESVKKLEARP